MYSILVGDELLYSDTYPNESRKATSPTLKMAVDEAGYLEFTISEVNKCYTKLERMKTIVTVEKYGIPIWDGRIIEESRDIHKNKKIYCEGAMAFLNDTTQPIKEYKNISFEEVIRAILDVHNNLVDDARKIFWGGIADSFNPEDFEYWATAYEYTIDAIKKVTDYHGCHYLVKKNYSTGLNEMIFFGGVIRNSGQTIMFGENLLDYTEDYDLSKLATVLLPLSQTDRESADTPRGPGTDIDLSHTQPFDDTKHYGVIMALTSHCVCRKYMKEDPHVVQVIPPYRNKLNLVAEEIAGSMTITGPDIIGMAVNPYTWKIPWYVQIWVVKTPGDRYTEQEAIDSELLSTPISNQEVSFNFVWDIAPDHFYDHPESHPYTAYMDSAYTDGLDIRTYRQRARVDFTNIVNEYGILSSTYTKYRTAVIEIDYSKIKTLYFTATHDDGFTENYRSISVWKKSLSFDENNTFIDRDRDRRMTSDKPFIYPSSKSTPDQEHNPGFYPAYGYSIGYKMDASVDLDTGTFADLVADDIPKILNPDKYEFVKEFTDINCFERKIDLNLDLNPETDSMRVLVVISGGQLGPFAVTVVSDDDAEVDSTITIGMDPNGIDLEKAHFIRYYDTTLPDTHNTWRPPEPGEECDPNGHWHANDIYDEELGYGVLVPVTSGFHIQTQDELEKIAKPNLNVWNDGSFNPYNTTTEPPSGDPNGIVTASNLNPDHKCCVFVTKASYEDENGRKYPNSIYVSTTMYGRSGIYAIFEFTDGNGNNGVWDVDSGEKPKNLRELKGSVEYGKYINGYTTLSAKKITMPYANDPDRLMMVVIGSYGESPKVWIHDPKQAEKMQYLTISSVNDGNPKLRANESNRFTSSLEYGDINDQNGSLSSVMTYDHLRTMEPISILSDGSYMFMFETSDDDYVISADVYIYGGIDGYIGHTGYQVITVQNPYIFLPYLHEGYRLNVVFRKRVAESDPPRYVAMNSNDVMYPMIWREDKSETLLFTQGSLVAVTDPVTEEVSIEADDTDDYTISTDIYYTTNEESCTLKISVEIDSAKMPATITVEESGQSIVYPIKSRTLYTSYWEQSPTIIQDTTNTTRQIVYKSYNDPGDIYVGQTFKISSSNNMRYKFYVYCEVDYIDSNEQIQTVTIEMRPEYIRTFSIVAYTDTHKAYIPPNDSFEKYGYIEKRVEFENVESSAELKARAEEYLTQSQFDEMTLKVKALDMTLVDPTKFDDLEIATSVRAISPPHGLYRDFPITELSIPFDNIANSTYELGYDNRDSLASLIQGG